jgi:hypothetical protein
MTAIFLRQKPTIEQLCVFLSAKELQYVFPLANSVAKAFSYEKMLKTALDARRMDCDSASAEGRIDVIEYLRENRLEPIGIEYSLEYPAANGNLEMVKWLSANCKIYPSNRAIDVAAGNGHLEIVQWLYENRFGGCTNAAMNWAAENGYLETVQWLYTKKRLKCCTKAAMNFAAMNGHVHVVEWLDKNVQLLHDFRDENDCYCAENVMDIAAENGRLKVLQSLHNNGRKCSSRALIYAGQKNHIEIAMWLYKNCREQCNLPRAILIWKDSATRRWLIEMYEKETNSRKTKN